MHSPSGGILIKGAEHWLVERPPEYSVWQWKPVPENHPTRHHRVCFYVYSKLTEDWKINIPFFIWGKPPSYLCIEFCNRDSMASQSNLSRKAMDSVPLRNVAPLIFIFALIRWFQVLGLWLPGKEPEWLDGYHLFLNLAEYPCSWLSPLSLKWTSFLAAVTSQSPVTWGVPSAAVTLQSPGTWGVPLLRHRCPDIGESSYSSFLLSWRSWAESLKLHKACLQGGAPRLGTQPT